MTTHKDLITRLMVAVVVVPVILALCVWHDPSQAVGGKMLPGLMVAVLVIAGIEWTALMRLRGTMYAPLMVCGSTCLPILTVVNHGLRPSVLLLSLVSVVCVLWGCAVGHAMRASRRDPNSFPAKEVGSALSATGGVACIGLLGSFFVSLTQIPGWAHVLPLWVIGTVWVCDSAAYFSGIWIGTRRVFGSISPAKTLEGALAGLIVPLVVIAGTRAVFGWPSPSLWVCMAMTLAMSAAGQLGDLVESLWKRSAGVKDSSALIPGHGGVLDKVDSLLFASPVAYYGWYFFLQ